MSAFDLSPRAPEPYTKTNKEALESDFEIVMQDFADVMESSPSESLKDLTEL